MMAEPIKVPFIGTKLTSLDGSADPSTGCSLKLFDIPMTPPVQDAHQYSNYDEEHPCQRHYPLRFPKDDPADRERIDQPGVIDYSHAGNPFTLQGVGQEYLAQLRESTDEEEIQPVHSLRSRPVIKQADKTDEKANQLKMQHDRQRVLP